MAEPTDYANLAAYLEAHASVVAGGLDDVSALSELAGEVKVAAVQSLLLARAPDVLDSADPERFVMLIEALNGIAIEVESIVGSDPTDVAVRKLAVWAITVGVAAQLEGSLFPEQQLGGQDSAASQLQVRYLALLKQLRASAGAAVGALPAGAGPLGSFPAALPYPDPVEAPVRTVIGWPW